MVGFTCLALWLLSGSASHAAARRVRMPMVAAMAALTHVPVGAVHLERFESVLPPEDYERMRRTVRRGREGSTGA